MKLATFILLVCFSATAQLSPIQRAVRMQPVAFAPGSIYDSTLIGWWKTDEGTGTAFADSAFARYNTGTVVAGTWGTGKFGNCLVFANASNQYGTATNTAAFKFSATNFSISLWVKDDTAAASLSGSHRIISWYDGTNNIAVCLGRDTTTLLRQYFLQNASTTVAPAVVTGGDAPLGWNHVVVMRSNTVSLAWLNNVFSTNGTIGANPGAFTGNTTNIYFGQRGDGASTTFMNGSIDNVRVYNRTISTNEINSLFYQP